MQLAGRADWAPMTAIHDALRRDLDQLRTPRPATQRPGPAGSCSASQLTFHFAAEHAAMWPRVRARLTGDPHGQALLEAMEDERQPDRPAAGHDRRRVHHGRRPQAAPPAADQAADQADQSPRPRGSRGAARHYPDPVPGPTRRDHPGHPWRAQPPARRGHGPVGLGQRQPRRPRPRYWANCQPPPASCTRKAPAAAIRPHTPRRPEPGSTVVTSTPSPSTCGPKLKEQ